jgi:L-ascorbate metabolism protein UlaG (beta-lactamase superfamily)
LERPVGKYSLGDVDILGFADKHMYKAKGSYLWTEAFDESNIKLPPNNPLNLDNSIILIKTGGISIVHWGDNRPDPQEYVLKAVKNADVLILPIDDSEHILTSADIKTIISYVNPKVIIPAHYKTKGAVSTLSTLKSADEWVKSNADFLLLKSASYEFDIDIITKFNKKVVYFGDNYIKK